MFISQLILSVYLQVSVPPGALDCWVFLSCLEVLQRIEGCCDRAQIDANVSHTVGLWSYATEKVSKRSVADVVLQFWVDWFCGTNFALLFWNLIWGSVYCPESSLDQTSRCISTYSTLRWCLAITRVCSSLCLSPPPLPLVWLWLANWTPEWTQSVLTERNMNSSYSRRSFLDLDAFIIINRYYSNLFT